jgi:hypothetical protein
MTNLMGFGTFAALPDEQLSEKISRRILSGRQGMVVWWSFGAGVHVCSRCLANTGYRGLPYPLPVNRGWPNRELVA